MADRKALVAHVAPFLLFMLGLALVQGVQKFAGPTDLLLLKEPMYWVYPLQTLVCAAALIAFWKSYDFGPRRPLLLAAGVGLAVFAMWVSPQVLFDQPARTHGFNPDVFAGQPEVYWCTVVARFMRLVIVVPLVEEIFWRGFLQRYLVEENFSCVPFGKYTHLSFWGVALAFASVHWGPDFVPALATGAIYGWLAVRTKSLFAPIAAHAVTNLALGAYIMATKQWGFW